MQLILIFQIKKGEKKNMKLLLNWENPKHSIVIAALERYRANNENLKISSRKINWKEWEYDNLPKSIFQKAVKYAAR